MEKDPDARPANAAQVISRIAAIEGRLGTEAPEFEADRRTVRASDPPDAVAGTRHDEAMPESGRATVLTPERIAELSGPNTVGMPPWELAAPPARPPTPSPVPPQPGPPIRSEPQAAAGRGGGTPYWPVAPQQAPRPRRRPVWRGAVSTLVTAAIVAGVGVYLWEREHQTLKITGVDVTPANPSVGCNGTADIIGTISTNGHGGTISYQWVEDGIAKSPLVADDATGNDKVQVALKWAFHVKGSGQSVAELRVLNPQQAETSITFPYSCPK